MARTSRKNDPDDAPERDEAHAGLSLGAWIWTSLLATLLALPVEAARYRLMSQPLLASVWSDAMAAEPLDAAGFGLGALRVLIAVGLSVLFIQLWMGRIGDGVVSALGAGLLAWLLCHGFAFSELALLRLAPPIPLAWEAGLTLALWFAIALIARWGSKPARGDDEQEESA